MVLTVIAHLCYINIESAHTGMAVAGEVEVTVGTESRKHFITFGIDRLAYVFYASPTCCRKAHAPDVETSFTTRHITHEIEPFSIGRDSGVGIR